MGKEQVSQLLEQFGQLVGIKGLGLNENDTCVISFDKHIVLNFTYVKDDDKLLIFSNLGRVGKTHQAKLLPEMLEAGFYERVRGGPSLGFDKESATALLIHRISVQELHLSDFEKTIDNYVTYAEAWIRRIEALPDDSFTTDSESYLPSMFDLKV